MLFWQQIKFYFFLEKLKTFRFFKSIGISSQKRDATKATVCFPELVRSFEEEDFLWWWKVLSLVSKREHVTPKHALIGCQTWHDWSSNIWSLADSNANFRTQNVHHQQIRAKPIYFHGYTRSKTTFAKGLSILTQVLSVKSFCYFVKVRATRATVC